MKYRKWEMSEVRGKRRGKEGRKEGRERRKRKKKIEKKKGGCFSSNPPYRVWNKYLIKI